MTEAAIKRAKKQKINRIIIIASAIILVLLIVLWIVQFNITNSKAIPQLVEYYEPGDFVEVGDNFYIDGFEMMDGYSYRVNGAKSVKFDEYLKLIGHEELLENRSKETIPEKIILLDITLKNSGNTDGNVFVLKYSLYSGSLCMSADFQLWSMIDERFTGNAYIKLLENSEADMIIPFIPMEINTVTMGDEVNRRINEEDFYFCICEFPVRKMIRVEIEK